MRWGLLLVVGCGRIAFDPLSDACRRAEQVPASISFGGRTFRYTSFDNMTATIPATQVRISGDGVDATSTSDAAGNYRVDVPIDGVARRVAITYSNASYFATVLYPDLSLDRDVLGANAARWSLGDGPLWNGTAVDAVYAAAGVTRDPSLGTLNIAVRDCADNIIEGVAVDVIPAPERLEYTAVDGTPSQTLTGTIGPFAHALALNVPVGGVSITATKAGLAFAPVEVTVQSDTGTGGTNTLTLIHAIE